MEKQFMENNLNPQDSSMLFHLAQMQINSNILGFFVAQVHINIYSLNKRVGCSLFLDIGSRVMDHSRSSTNEVGHGLRAAKAPCMTS